MNPYAVSVPTKRRKFQENTKQPPLDRAALAEEISSSESDVTRSFLAYGQNPDPVARSKGIKIYQEMMEDDQVKAVVELRKQARLSTPWVVAPGVEGNAESERMAEFVRHNFDRIQGTFEDALYGIFSAIEFGFSISEIVYEDLQEGPFKGMIGLKAIKTREPYNYDFKTDPHGNLLGIVYSGPQASPSGARLFMPGTFPFASPREGDGSATARDWGTDANPFPPEKFVVYSYNSQFGNHYGRSDLLAAFRSWQSKKHIMKFWNIWLERYASPLAVATHDSAVTLSTKALAELDDFLRTLSAKSGIRVPKGVTLELVQSSTAAGQSYEQAIEAHNRFIAHAVLCPNLLGYTQQPSVGSYALGKKHFDAFLWIINKMGRDVSETIVGEQIISRLVPLNFPQRDRSLWPVFKFESVEEESIEARSRIVTMLATYGFLDPAEEWVRDFLTLPQRDPKFAPKPGEKPSGRGGEEEDDDGEGREFQEARREPNEFEKKVRFKELAREADRADEAFFLDCSRAIEAMRDKFLAKVERKEIVREEDLGALDDLTMNAFELKEAVRKWMVKIHLDSKLRALEELGRAGVAVEVTRKFAEAAPAPPMEPWEPLPPREAIDFFNRKVSARIEDADGKLVLIDMATGAELAYYDKKAFAIAGVVRDDLLNDAKQVILNGLRQGDERGTMKDLRALFDRYVSRGIAVDDKLLEPRRLRTIVRTNTTEAINNGRAALYEDSVVRGFVRFWQYSAILDERTTDYCRCMDGKVFEMEDLLALQPDAHYNCRSITVPITRFELEDLAKEGRGVEVSEPCPGRMAGFSEIHWPPMAVPRVEVIDISKGVPEGRTSVSGKNELTPERLAELLGMSVFACPYSKCRSPKIELKKTFYNIGEFSCVACLMPFRVSNAGDIYLYDSGEERWERVTMGYQPNFFQEILSVVISEPVSCPYSFCRSTAPRFMAKKGSVKEYSCGKCGLPFRISTAGEVYLYDAGEEKWMKMGRKYGR